MKPENIQIQPLETADFPAFFAYLDAQLADNGKNGFPLFQPVSRDVMLFPSDKESTFVAGLGRSLEQHGWRRAWIILGNKAEIMGHVDLRAPMQSGIKHRALLGMGVSRAFRRQGLARCLLDFAIQWMKDSDNLDWLDIEVLAANEPAIGLYRNAGFEQLCVIEDMFRIDGQSEAVIRMTQKIARQ